MKQMTKKTLLFLALAILIAGGAGCLRKSQEPIDQIDDWKMVRIEELGFEIELPEEEASAHVSLVPDTKDHEEYWQNSIGSAQLGGGRGAILRFFVKVKKTDDTLQEFNEKNDLEFGSQPAEQVINGMPIIALKNPSRIKSWGPVQYEQIAAIKVQNYIYYLDFQSNLEMLDLSETEEIYPPKMKKVDEAVLDEEWQRILSSFRVFDPISYVLNTTSVDTSNWKLFSDESLGFEMIMPSEWSGSTKGGISEGVYNVVNERHPFWWDLVGFGTWSSPEINLDIKVKKTDVSLQEFNDNIGLTFGLNPEETTLNGYPSLLYSYPIHCRKDSSDLNDCQAWNLILIQNGDLYYYIDFHLSASSLDRAVDLYDEWDEALESLTLFQPKP